jgi:hypothetical protein
MMKSGREMRCAGQLAAVSELLLASAPGTGELGADFTDLGTISAALPSTKV